MNDYAFAGDDRVNGRDPSGLDGCITYDTPGTYVTFGDHVWYTPGFSKTVCITGGGSGSAAGGGGTDQGQPTKPAVVKHYRKTTQCAANAGQVMAAVEGDFPRFGNYSVGPLSVTFSPPRGLTVGSSIPIRVGIGPFTQSMTVTVQSQTSQAMTFVTTQGHLLYPASITFSASTASPSAINFSINLAGSFPSTFNHFEFVAGGGAFEDAQWNHLLGQVGAFCKAGR